LSEVGPSADFDVSLSRIKLHNPVAKPKMTPSTRNRAFVPNFWSIHNPTKPGNTISSEMVVTREVHSAARANGGRSSGESVTGGQSEQDRY